MCVFKVWGGVKGLKGVHFSLGFFSFLLIYLHPLCYLDISFLLAFFFPIFLLRQNTHNIKCTIFTPFKYKVTMLCYIFMLCLWSSFHLVKLKLYPLNNNISFPSFPSSLAATLLLSVSANLTVLVSYLM